MVCKPHKIKFYINKKIKKLLLLLLLRFDIFLQRKSRFYHYPDGLWEQLGHGDVDAVEIPILVNKIYIFFGGGQKSIFFFDFGVKNRFFSSFSKKSLIFVFGKNPEKKITLPHRKLEIKVKILKGKNS